MLNFTSRTTSAIISHSHKYVILTLFYLLLTFTNGHLRGSEHDFYPPTPNSTTPPQVPIPINNNSELKYTLGELFHISYPWIEIPEEDKLVLNSVLVEATNNGPRFHLNSTYKNSFKLPKILSQCQNIATDLLNRNNIFSESFITKEASNPSKESSTRLNWGQINQLSDPHSLINSSPRSFDNFGISLDIDNASEMIQILSQFPFPSDTTIRIAGFLWGCMPVNARLDCLSSYVRCHFEGVEIYFAGLNWLIWKVIGGNFLGTLDVSFQNQLIFREGLSLYIKGALY